MQPIVLEKLAYARKYCVCTKFSCIHNDEMEIGDRIKKRREELGITSHTALADQIGVAWQTVQQWENGKTAPTRARLPKVAEVLNTSPEWLLHGVGNPDEISDKQENQYDTLADAYRLMDLFHKSTADGREAILRMAELAEKAAVHRSRSSNDET